jgi:hypothetical protein
MLAVEVTRNCFDQNWEGGLTPQATRLPQRGGPPLSSGVGLPHELVDHQAGPALHLYPL